MKFKTKTRWLAAVLCAVMLLTMLMPAARAIEENTESDPEDISPVVSALSIAPLGSANGWQDTDMTAVVRGERSLKASVMSVPAGESVYIQRGGYVNYGDGYVTDFYSVWMGEDALAHEGDVNYAAACFCACPSMTGLSTGHYSGSTVQKLSEGDVSGSTLNVFKAVILTSPYGSIAKYHQNFWSVYSVEPTDEVFAMVHAILGYLYDPGSAGTAYHWSSEMKSTILGTGGLLEQIINWANANADALNEVEVFRLKGTDNGLQDLVWMRVAETFPLSVKKVSADPKLTDGNDQYSLAGAEYTIYRDANCTNAVGTLTTNADGVTGMLNVVEGSYYAKETKAPKGYALNSAVLGPVTVSASNNPGVFNASDSPLTTNGAAKLVKQSSKPADTDGNSYYSLANAEYTVYADEQLTKSVGVLKTDKDGNSQTMELDAGTYYVKETKAPSGFEEDETVHTMVVKSGETTTLTVKDVYIPGRVTLQKSSANGKVTDGSEDYSLEGAEYGVYSDKSCTAKVGSLTTKADGSSNTITVPAGTYYAKELKAPTGFQLNADVYSVTVKPGETGTIKASDEPDSGSLTLVKSSADPDSTNGNGNYSLEGTVYTVYSDAACTAKVGTLTTDKDGSTKSLSVPYGSYYAKETKAPKGFKLDDAVLGPVIVDANHPTGTFYASDVPETGTVTLKKQSADPAVTDGNENYTLTGAEYTVYSDQECKVEIGKLTTKADGSSNTLSVMFGSFYAKETKAPKGFKLDDAVLGPVTVDESNNAGVFLASDQPESGKVKLEKQSAEPDQTNGNENYSLSGAVFTVFTDESCTKQIGTLTTGEDGSTESLTVSYGSYYAKETKAPKGFKLDDAILGPVTVDASHDTGVFTATDVPEKGELKLMKQSAKPEATDGNENYSLAGAEYTVYSDQACENVVGKLTTKEDGSSNTLTVMLGTYYIRETKAPKGFETDKELHALTVKADATEVLTVKDAPIFGFAALRKETANADVTVGNSCYSLAGAKYGVYTDEGCTKQIGTFTTDAEGNTTAIEVPAATYYVKELEVPAGYALDETIYPISVKCAETSTLRVSDLPIMNPVELLLQKIDIETKQPVPQADASLAGAEYTVRFYAGQYDTAEKAEASGNPARTWVFRTDEQGQIRYQTKTYFVSGDKLYLGADGKTPMLPLGTVVVQESKAAPGYLMDTNVYLRNITEDGKHTVTVQTYSAPTSPEQIIKGNIQIVKHTDTGLTKIETPEEGAAFEIYLTSAGSYDKADNTIRDRLEIDKDGFAKSKDLPYGTYTVHQTNGWDGSAFIGDFQVVIDTDGKTYSYIINNERFYAFLKVVKIDSVTGEAIPVEGIGFQVFTPAGELVSFWGVDTWYSNAEGIVKVPTDLEYGIGYKAVEQNAPEGYILAAEPFTFDITTENAEKEDDLIVVTLEAKNTPTQVQLLKVDPYGQPVSGAKLVLVDASGKTVDEWTSDEMPHTIYKLPVGGTFTLRETAAPDGYLLAEPVTFTVQETTEIQTVTMENEKIPTIGTTATTDGLHVAQPKGEVEIVDTVHYADVVPGRTYTLSGVLMDKATGEPCVDADGSQFTASVTFTPEAAEGDVEVRFHVDAALLEGKTTVCFEHLSKNGKQIAVHADITDEGQSVYWPEIHTTATADGEHVIKAEGEVTLTDVVQYTNLLPGMDYVVTGTLVDKITGEAVTDENGVELTAEQRFTPESAEGSIEVTFQIPDASILLGKVVVAFETVSYLDRELAIHADLSDEDQTVYFPGIGTTATVDGEHEAYAGGTIMLVDTVEYKGLQPGKTYTVKGILMNKATGEPFGDVTAEAEFTPTDASGAAEVTFQFDTAELTEDTVLVAFETLYYGDTELAVHADLEDVGQTVTIYVPTMHTTATVNGAKTAAFTGKIALDDLVTFSNLKVGQEYTLKGTLMDKSTGKAFLVGGKEVTSEVTFTPDQSNGEVKVTFLFDGSGITKETTLVVFETLYREGVELLVHADLEDADQTVTLDIPNAPQTGDAMTLRWFCIGGGSLLLASLCGLLLVRRKKSDHEAK